MTSWRVPIWLAVFLKAVEFVVVLTRGMLGRLGGKASETLEDCIEIFSDEFAGVLFIFVYLGYAPISIIIFVVVSRVMTNKIVVLSVIFSISLVMYMYMIFGGSVSRAFALDGAVMFVICLPVFALLRRRAMRQSRFE